MTPTGYILAAILFVLWQIDVRGWRRIAARWESVSDDLLEQLRQADHPLKGMVGELEEVLTGLDPSSAGWQACKELIEVLRDHEG